MSTKTRLSYKRKREGKTNYKKRLALLKSRTDRLVIRKSNKQITAQIIRYEPAGDKVLLTANSKELAKIGWKNSFKNLSASYLIGFLLGKKASEKKIKNVIVDLGLQTPIKGSRLYAVVKGAIDSGLNIPTSEEVFPPDDRIKGKHISEKVSKDFEDIKKKLEK